VAESPAASAADVTSAATGAGATTVYEVEKVGTSAPPAVEGEDGDRGTSEPQEVPPRRGILDEGMEAVNDEDRCLYIGTPWEAEVITDKEDLEKFRVAVQTIGTVLLVRTFWLSSFDSFLSCLNTMKFLRPPMVHVQSLAEQAQARTGLLRGTANAHAKAAVAREAKLQVEVAAAREIQRIKEAMARHARRDADDLKRKLEDA
jgi:hypothetical protein